jgi:hypothetical protein
LAKTPITKSSQLDAFSKTPEEIDTLLREFLDLMKVSDALDLKKEKKKYWKCDELESEFVEIKCEIEMMKSKNKMLQDEAKRREDIIEYYDKKIH